jgi:hypothetical protein
MKSQYVVSTVMSTIPEAAVARPEISRPPAGMQIDRRDTHNQNVHSARRETIEPNVNCERWRQRAKHDWEIVRHDEGIENDWSEAQSTNGASPRIEILQPGSNATFQRFLQDWKHWVEIASIDERMQIDRSDSQQKNVCALRLLQNRPLRQIETLGNSCCFDG